MKNDFEAQELSLAQRKIILGLFLIPKFGFYTILKLFKIFQDWEKIWNLSYIDLKNKGFSEKFIQQFVHHKNKTNLDKIWEIYKNIHLLTYFDKNYPFLLKQTYSPPLILFARGNLELLKNKNLLSVIGSRKFSQYGKSIAQNFIKLIAEKNITIVSGLAIGIDSLAHIEAVNTKASTIAVLGSSINQIYPRSNLRLAEKIIQNGLLISEFPIGSQIRKENFPKRNRIIAGLSQATLIIEASQRSGTLITAQYALNENREVLAVPGSIFQNNSRGTNNLIRQGAKIITEIKDILEIYNITENKEYTYPKLKNKNEKIIYDLLKNGPLNINKIISLSKIDPSIIISCLTQMELSGLIINIGNQNYQLK